ncbi:MAG: hypothetical protein RQ867_06550 [Mariprofundaceae bacterium]|nr:hypothetical protein [Mariprofundaceae bacterium]
MDQLLGFAVLTGPLFLIVLWVPVCIAVAVWIARKKINKGLPIRIVGGFAVFLLALFLPVADEIVGRVYLNHLCETEAGAKVYQTIELPAEYWDEDGKPRFIEANGEVHWKQLVGMAEQSTVTKTHSSLFSITDRRVVIKNNANQISGEVIIYMFWGGWLIRATTSSNAAVTCDGWRSNRYWYDFYNGLFQSAKILAEKGSEPFLN